MGDLNKSKRVADDFRTALKTNEGPSIDLMQDFQKACDLEHDELVELLAHTMGTDTQTLKTALQNGDLSHLSETNREIYSMAMGILFADSDQAWNSMEEQFKSGCHHKLKM